MNTKLISILLTISLISVLMESAAVPSSIEEQKKTADSLYNLAKELISYNPDTALHYAKKHKSIAYKIDDYTEKVYSCFMLGYVYSQLNYFDKAAYNYFEGLAFLKNPREEHLKELKARYLHNIGVVYINTYSYKLALEYTKQGLALSKAISNTKLTSEIGYNIGYIYFKDDNFQLAKEHLKQSIKNNISFDYKKQLAMSYNSLGNVYHHQKKFDSARIHYLKALEISNSEASLKKKRAIYLSNLGENYFKLNQYPEAKEKYLSALEVSEKLNDTDRIKFILNNLGDVLLKENNYKGAIDYYQRSLELNKNTQVINEEYARATKGLAKSYDRLGNYQLASDYKGDFIAQLEKIKATKEKLAQKNAQYRMKEVKWQLEKERQEAELWSLKMENYWVKLLIGVAIIAIFVASYYIRKYYSIIVKIKKIVNNEVPSDYYL